MVAGGACNGFLPLLHLAGSRCLSLWEGNMVPAMKRVLAAGDSTNSLSSPGPDG